MIKSYRNKATKQLCEGEPANRLPVEIRKRAMMRLNQLDAAASLDDLRMPPSNQLEALQGNRKGQHSIRINKQWRVCFVWKDGHAYDVEVADYINRRR